MIPPGTVSTAAQQQLLDYLNAGGGVYIEGTSVTEDLAGTDLLQALGASYLSSGPQHDDVGQVYGASTSFMAEKLCNYMNHSDADIFIDRIQATTGNLVMSSTNGDYGRVVANETGSAHSIVSSILFGAVSDSIALSTKANILQLYHNYLTNHTDPTLFTSMNHMELGLTEPGVALCDTLYLQNQGLQELQLNAITLNGDAFTLDVPAVTALCFGDCLPVIVHFSAAFSGDFAASIEVQTNDPAATTMTIPITASCYQPPTMELPDAISAEVAMGESVTVALTLQNSGELPLSFWIGEVPPNRSSGGPDGYGYRWVDSNDPNGPEYVWNDISSSGALLDLSGSNSFVNCDLPFGFPFYGEIMTQVKVTSNGYLTFGSDGADRTNDPIPNAVLPNNAIYPFWDNLTADNGQVYWWEDTASQKVIVQYTNWTTSTGAGNYTFQVHLHQSGDVQFFYHQMDGMVGSASIGIEDQDGATGLQIAYNEPYIENTMAIAISSGISWLRCGAYTGTVAPGETQTVQVTIDASSLAQGNYEAQLMIHSNDPQLSVGAVPVSVEVIPTSAAPSTSPSSVWIANAPNPFNPSTEIRFNLGDAGVDAARSVEVDIYNVKGQCVRVMHLDAITENAGTFVWNGCDAHDKQVCSGLYFACLRVNNRICAKTKMMLLK
jgi:hypothetical protein